MEGIERGSKKGLQYDYSIQDICKFFEEQKLKFTIPHIISKLDGTERNKDEIRLRIEKIRSSDFSEERRKELAESKTEIRKVISRYLKGKSDAEKIKETCILSLPDYIEDDIDHLIKDKEIYKETVKIGVEKSFSGMYMAFKKIFNEYKEKPLTDKEIIKKMLKIFYNAQKIFEEEWGKAKIEYEEEMRRRDKQNDANDLYTIYESLNSPKDTARNIVYEMFFGYIDPNGKFKDRNRLIFDIIIKEFESKKGEYKQKAKRIDQEIKEETIKVKEQQNRQHEALLEQFTEPTTNNEGGSDNKKKEEEKIETKKRVFSQEKKGDDRAKHSNGGVYPHREGETPYD